MRDLYLRLNIGPRSTPEGVRLAIRQSQDPILRRDATTVLLDKDKRAYYDQLRQTITLIGSIRQGLDLAHSYHWQGDIARDFSQQSRQTRQLYQEFLWKIRAANANPPVQEGRNKGAGNKRVKRTSYAIVGALAVFLLLVLMSQKKPVVIQPLKPQETTREETRTRSEPSAIPQENRPANKIPRTIRRQEPIVLQPVEIVPPYPIQALPSSGEVRRFTREEAIAPFEINTSGDRHYLVKLVDAIYGNDIMTIFVRGGRRVEVDVPIGNYEMKYASGSTWYGYTHLFGPETIYSKAETVFKFFIIGNQLSGNTVTLYPVPRGNLQTSSIDAEEF